MPNYRGSRAPNGSWSEDTPRRRAQKAAAQARFRERHRRDPLFRKNHNQASRTSRRRHAHAIAERRSARRFRWIFRRTATEAALLRMGWSSISRGEFLRGDFVVVHPDGKREKEQLESPERLERRLRAMGAVG